MSKSIESMLSGFAKRESQIEDHIAREMMAFSGEDWPHNATVLLLRNGQPSVYRREYDDDGLPSVDSVDEAVLGDGAAAVVCFLASYDDHFSTFVSISSVGGRCILSVGVNTTRHAIPYGRFRAILISLVEDSPDYNELVFPELDDDGLCRGSLASERCWVDGTMGEEAHLLSVYPAEEHPRYYGGGSREPLPSINRLDEMILGGAGVAFTFRETVINRGVVVFQITCARGRCTLGKYLERQELSYAETIEYQQFREMYEEVSSRKGE